MFVFNKEQKWNLDQRMLCRAELCTITRTLIACFSRRAQEPLRDPLPRPECPVSGISETLPAKDESSNNGGSKHRDAALYNKSTLFPSKGEGISTFFFNYRFHNGKVDRYLSSFSGSVLTQAATFLVSHAGSPSLHVPFFPTLWREHRQLSKGTQKQAPWPRQSNVWFHNLVMDTRDHD